MEPFTPLLSTPLCAATVAAAQDWHTGAVENWEIQRVVAVDPSGIEWDAAYLVRIAYGEEQAEQAQIVVEFAAPSAVASGGYAQEVVGKFLRDDEPPQHLVVERDGSVRIAVGPKVSGPNDAPRTPRSRATTREPQRGRRRGNR